jgi:hypothetical protein
MIRVEEAAGGPLAGSCLPTKSHDFIPSAPRRGVHRRIAVAVPGLRLGADLLPEVLCGRTARSMLSCHWPIINDVGAAFAREFLNGLDRLPRDAALQRAQRLCLENRLLGDTKRQMSHPY